MKKPGDIKVLVACETSGTVRNAFLSRGFDAYSVDILPSDDDSSRHIQSDVLDILDNNWDLMIGHPPCTRLCLSGVRWLHKPPKGRTYCSIIKELNEGAKLFSRLWNANIKYIILENPIMHRYARVRIKNYKKPQIVHPWWFGEPYFKATGLYYKNLPELKPTKKLIPPSKENKEEYKKWSKIHLCPPSKDRWKTRSKTFDGLANAIADQIGNYVLNN